MTPAIERVGARWRELLAAFSSDPGGINAELSELLAAYSAADRHYHDISHIDAMLQLSRTHRADLRDAVVVDLAIFYHDVIYDAARRDNEEASAARARTGLGVLGVPGPVIETVARYVEATKHMAPGPVEAAGWDTDLDHLLDFDLSILAADDAAYDAYAAAIRREYMIYADDAYRAGRAKVLSKLMALPTLYRVPVLKAAWEPRAKANLARELGALSRR